ncbi:Glycerophosphodiester phosphodiesterase, partial [Dysosmobacter welbionis]
QIIALLDGEAVEVGVPGGVCDLGRGDGAEASRHGVSNGLGIRRVEIHVHHGGDALGHGLGGDHHHLLLRQGGTLLGCHNNVAVVGQDEHRLRRDLVHALQNTLGGGVHGLPTGHHTVGPQVPEHGGQAVPGAHRQKAVGLLRRRHGGRFFRGDGLQLRLHRVQVIGALDVFARGQVVRLGPHVLDLGQLQSAVLLGLVQGVAGDVGVDVDLKGLIVLADHQTVTDAVEICPQRLQRDIGHGLADDEYRVEGEGDVLRRHGGEVCLLLSGLASLRLGHGLAPQFRQ